jgi:trk system potassium uptake protein TrkA
MKFCIIGLGRFGYPVAETLAANGMEVLAIDSNEAIVASIRDKVTQAICMQISDKESLEAIGIDEIETVIVSIGENFAQSVLITALLTKELNIPHVIARATNKIHADVLKLVGASKVILPERDQGIRLANNLSFPFLDLINVTDSFAITKLQAPHSFIGKSLYDLDLRKKYHVICLGVQKGTEIMLTNLDYVILEGDLLFFAGDNRSLEALARSA